MGRSITLIKMRTPRAKLIWRRIEICTNCRPRKGAAPAIAMPECRRAGTMTRLKWKSTTAARRSIRNEKTKASEIAKKRENVELISKTGEREIKSDMIRPIAAVSPDQP
jgi:hypothetical protein